MNYSDTDLTFYLITYRDFERAVWCLDLVRIAYPNARIVIDVDGDRDPRWRDLEKMHRAEVHYGDRLFLLDKGGAIISRMLDHFLTDPEQRQWMFRIDTDTEIRRPFRRLPESNYFGTYNGGMVQGGCVGMTRLAAEILQTSRCLERRDLVYPATWQRGREIIAHERVALGLLSFDWILAWAMEEVGITGDNFTEVQSNWRQPVAWDRDVAVAHPCKDIPVRRPRI